MARYRRQYRQPPLVLRRLTASMATGPFHDGQVIVGKQTRHLEVNDWVLVARDDTESIAQILRHQGDLIYLLTDPDGGEPTWTHAKYVVAKIIWPADARD